MKEQIFAVEKMKSFIDKHFLEQISINDLSQIALYSKWHCFRLFVFYYGISPKAYIRKLRLVESAKVLAKNQKNVSDVAFQCGFNSVDGFSRAFRKEYGCNPNEFALRGITVNNFNLELLERKENNMKTLGKFLCLILAFALGFGSCYFWKKSVSTNNTDNSYSGTEVASLSATTYKNLTGVDIKNSDSISTTTRTSKLAKSGESDVLQSQNQSSGLIETKGKKITIDGVEMDFSNVPAKVLKMLQLLLQNNCYDIFSKVCLFKVKDAEGIQPSTFDIKVKLTGFNSSMLFEFYLSYEGGAIYEAVSLTFDEKTNTTNICFADIEFDSSNNEHFKYGIYNFANDTSYTLDKTNSMYESSKKEIENYCQILKLSNATEKPDVDFASIYKSVNA